VASPAIQEAVRVVRSGELGRLVQVVSLAPHRLNRALRPSWFFDRPAYGGIINDIGVHSIDQFLALADVAEAEIESSTIGAFGTEPAGFEDFAEISLSTPSVRGYCRVDWFTPDGLPTWGDGRLFLVGTRGTLELRKNLDIEGRAGSDHMFVAGRERTRYLDCSALPVTYFRDVVDAVRTRDFAALPQEQVFTVCRMALAAQANAKRFVAERRP
jgi:predicted dehydrogenase